MVQRPGAGHHRPHQGRHQLRPRQGRQGHEPADEVLGEGGSVSYPWKGLDTWFVTENIRWGKFEANIDAKALVDKVNRSDLWLEAAKILGVAGAPTSDSRGVETFFDGVKFDPAAPLDYLKALKIKRVV